MDLPHPEWIKHVEQTWTHLKTEESQCFSSLVEVDEIFHAGLAHITQECLEVLSSASESSTVRKSTEYAKRFREKGNGCFKARDYTTASLFYSKGVCHASKATEHLSLCYANRSAALFHLSRYKDCLQDISRALEEGYPSHLQHKLSDRKTQCLNHLKAREQKPGVNHGETLNPKDLMPQGDKREDEVSTVLCGVSVCYSPKKGRHLLATADKHAGEVILTDRAFSWVLIPGEGHSTERGCTETPSFGTEDRYCHHCLCPTLSPVPCDGCSYARYCGERCQREAWQMYHLWECPVGSELRASGVLAHLALRVALTAGLKEVQKAREDQGKQEPGVPGFACHAINQKDENSEEHLLEGPHGGQKPSPSHLPFAGRGPSSATCTKGPGHSRCFHDSYLGIYGLLPHVTQHAPDLRFLLAVTMAALYQKLRESGPPPASWDCCQQEGEDGKWAPEMDLFGATALRHVFQLRCNAQGVRTVTASDESGSTVQSSREIRMATAVFPVLSLLNHSCSPNTSMAFTAGSEASPVSIAMVTGSRSEASPSAGGVAVTVRVSRDVAAGRELLHCYGPHCSRMEVKERQHLLQEQYFFLCDCEACQHDLAAGVRGQGSTAAAELKCQKCAGPMQSSGDVYQCRRPSCHYQLSRTELRKRSHALRADLDQALRHMEMDRTDEALKALQMAVTKADCVLTKSHPLQGELADALARAYATTGEWRRAAVYLQSSVSAIRAQYGEESIELGQQLFKLAQLHFNGGDPHAALSVMPSARRLLSLHRSPRCEELLELQAMEECLQGLV